VLVAPNNQGHPPEGKARTEKENQRKKNFLQRETFGRRDKLKGHQAVQAQRSRGDGDHFGLRAKRDIKERIG